MLRGPRFPIHKGAGNSAGDDARPGVSVPLAVFLLGLVVGLGLGSGLEREFLAGLAILAVLSLILLRLSRQHENSRQRLAAGEVSYRAFFECAVDGIFRTTPDGRYLAVNQALADIYGYPTPEALISQLTDIGARLYVAPGRRNEFRDLMQNHDQVSDFVSEIYTRSGNRIWISENARAVRDWSGELICYEGTVEDVTQKLEAERALRAALLQAELANQAKAAFLAAMSHELKTPLNAVLGFSEIIRDEMLGPVGKAAYRDYARDIHASGRRLLSVVNDVLDASRLEGGQLTLEPALTGAHDIAEHALARARAAAGQDRAIATDIPWNLPGLVVDAQRMAQALGNLLSNAIKFTTPAEGQIALEARLREDGGVSFTVTDNGIGMAQETIAAALEPFRQLDSSLSRKFEGAGLGLSLARALTERQGGALEIQSAVGKGTRVSIHLPAACSQKAARSA